MGFNVLQVMNYGAAYPGNFIRSMMALERRLSADGGQMIYVFPQRAKERAWVHEMKDSGHEIFFLSNSIPAAARELRRLICRFNIDIIHSHFMNYSSYIPIRLARIFNKDIPHIVHVHSQPKRAEKPLLDALRKKIIDEYIFICVSNAVAVEFSKRGHKCTTVINGVDFTRLESFEALDRFDFVNRAEDRTILMFGYDFHIKGIDLAIKSLQKYDENHNIVLLLCVASHIEKAKEQIAELCGGIPDWIKLLPPRDDIASYYKLADAFVSASRSEGFNYSLVEAAYCGTAVAASDIPGQNELKIPFTFIFQNENEEQFFKAVSDALSMNKEETENYKDTARDYIAKNFSLDCWAEKIIDVYKKAKTVN